MRAVDIDSVDDIVDACEKGPEGEKAIEGIEVVDLALKYSQRVVVHIEADIIIRVRSIMSTGKTPAVGRGTKGNNERGWDEGVVWCM